MELKGDGVKLNRLVEFRSSRRMPGPRSKNVARAGGCPDFAPSIVIYDLDPGIRRDERTLKIFRL
jgi:hypothetical protein